MGESKSARGAVVLDQVAEVHEGDVVGDPVGLLQVVGDDHDGDVVAQLHDQVLDHRGRLRVERRAGLVEQQHLGLGGERAGDAEPLLLAAGELQRRVVEVVLDLLEQAGPVRARVDRGSSAFLRIRREPCSRRT